MIPYCVMECLRTISKRLNIEVHVTSARYTYCAKKNNVNIERVNTPSHSSVQGDFSVQSKSHEGSKMGVKRVIQSLNFDAIL